MKSKYVYFIAAAILFAAGATSCKKDEKEPKSEAVKVTGITLNKSAATIVAGESEQLSVAEVTPANATEKGVTWESKNPDRATVDETGMVEVPATATAGTVDIVATAKDGSGVTATCTVTVAMPDPRAPYFATWVSAWKNITFSADEVYSEGDDGGGWWYKVSPLTWKAVTNINKDTKDDYPTGYKVTGHVSEEENSGSLGVGDSFADDWAYFLHKDGNSIIEQSDYIEWYKGPFTKSGSEVNPTRAVLTGGFAPSHMRGSGKRLNPEPETLNLKQ